MVKSGVVITVFMDRTAMCSQIRKGPKAGT